jgi:hypothetical protein
MTSSTREQFSAQCQRARITSEWQRTPVYVVLGRQGSAETGEPYPTAVHVWGSTVTRYVWWRMAQQGRRFRVLRCYHHGKRIALQHSHALVRSLID